MKCFALACTLATGLSVLATGGRAHAQFGLPQPPTNPYLQPPVSPFLNINRGGGNPAVNYFGIVQPQLQTAQQLQALQMQQAQMMQLGTGANLIDVNNPGVLAATGHGSQFFNYGHYFGPPGGNVRPAAPIVSGIPRRQ
jgi:hypothetical protein